LGEPVAEGAEADTEQARGLHLHALALLEGALEHLFLEAIEPGLQIEALRQLAPFENALVEGGARAAHLRREDFRSDLVAVGEGDRALDEVLELAHVARKLV